MDTSIDRCIHLAERMKERGINADWRSITNIRSNI